MKCVDRTLKTQLDLVETSRDYNKIKTIILNDYKSVDDFLNQYSALKEQAKKLQGINDTMNLKSSDENITLDNILNILCVLSQNAQNWQHLMDIISNPNAIKMTGIPSNSISEELKKIESSYEDVISLPSVSKNHVNTAYRQFT